MRPVEFNGMIQNTAELSMTKVTEDAKTSAMQQNVQATVEKQDKEQKNMVQQMENAQLREMDYENGGDGTGYMGNWNRKKKDKKEEKKSGDGSVTKKTGHQSFDVKI